MTSKEEYQQVCQQEALPLFLEDWWMQAVCSGYEWDVLLCHDSENRVCGVMPYVTSKRFFRQYVAMPPLCPYGGAWLREDLKDSYDATAAVARDLHGQLEQMKIAYYQQPFYVGNRLPDALAEIGYRTKKRYTYRIEDTSDLNQLLEGFSKNKRKKLEKKTLTYQTGTMTAEEFYQFHVTCNAEKNKELWYSRETFLVLYEKSQEHDRSTIICIRDAEGEPLAAAFVVWDQHIAYQLMNCYVHEESDNGAREKLTLEVLRFVSHHGLGIDFVSHRNYLRHYGAKRFEFQVVRKSRSPLISLLFFNRWLRSFRYSKL